MAGEDNSTPILAGVVGWPVGHSLSPLIHGEWARRAGINGRYVPIPVEPDYDAFARAMDDLKSQGLKGVNITIPHKEHALRYADLASEAAKKIGAANMMTFSETDGCVAANSDATGFRSMLLDEGAAPARALVLGAGGAARAILWALRRKPFAAEILLTNRTRERAETIAPIGDARIIDWEDRNEAVEECDLLVNTTSLGMSGQPTLEIDLGALKPSALVADIVYSPLETGLLKAAKARGCKTIDGLAMLMHQAVPGFKAWFGGEAVVDDALRAILVAALKKQGRA